MVSGTARFLYPTDPESLASPTWSTCSTPRECPQPLKAPLLGSKGSLVLVEPEGSPLLVRLGLPSRVAFRLALIVAVLVGIVVGSAGALAASRLRGARSPTPAPALQSPWRSPITPDVAWIPEVNSVEPQGSMTKFEVDGRSVWVYKPAEVASGPLPAVVVLHGSDDTALNIAKTSRFDKIADFSAKGFLVVLPEMQHAGGVVWGYAADEPFFRSLVARVDREYMLDRKQVFVVGHSAGGTMALYLQNNLPGVFAAAASVEAGAGTLQQWRNASSGRPTMIVWNHNDQVLKEFGGEGLYRQTLQKLRRHDPSGIYEEPTYEEPLPTALGSDVMYASRKVWPAVGVQPELQVVSWASRQPSHHWLNSHLIPGATLDASVLIWEFFNAVACKAASPA